MPRSSWGESIFRPVICLLLSVIIGISPTLSLLAATNETSGPSNEPSPSGTSLNALKAAALLSQRIGSEAKPPPEKKPTPDIKISETKSTTSQLLTHPYTKSLQELSREILKRLLVPEDENHFQIEVSSSIVPTVALEQIAITRWKKSNGLVEKVKKALTPKETYQEVISRFSISLGALAFISNESEFAALIAHRLSKANPKALKNSLGEDFNENIESFFNKIQEYKDLHPTHRDAILADLHATERLIRGGFYPWGVYEVHYKIAQWNKKRSESRIERSLFKLFFGEDYIDIKAQPIPELRLSIIEKYVTYRQSQSDLADQTSQKSILPKTLKTLRLRATILASPFTNPWIRLAVASSFGIFWLSQSVDYQSIQNFYDTLSSQFHNIKDPEVANQIYQKGKWLLNASAALGGTFILLRYWNSILRTLGKGMAMGLSAGIYLLSAGYNFASELLKTLRDVVIATPNLLWKIVKTIPKPFLFAARLLIGATKSIMGIPSKMAYRFKNRAPKKVLLSGTSSKATSEIEAPLPNTESDIQATSQDDPTKKSWLSRLTQTLTSFETWRSVGRALYKTGDSIGEMTYRILSKTHEVTERTAILLSKIAVIVAHWLKEILLKFFRWALNKAIPAIWRSIQDFSLKSLLVAAWFLDLIPSVIEWFDTYKTDIYKSVKRGGYSTLKFSWNASTAALKFSWKVSKKIVTGVKHIILSPYYFIRAFYHGMKSLWKWHADRREKAQAIYLAEQDRLSEPERIINSALPDSSSLADSEAAELLNRLIGKLHLYTSPGSRRLKKSLKASGDLYWIPLHQSVPDTYISFDSKLILAFFKRIVDLIPRISSEGRLKIKSYIFDLLYSNPTAIFILPEFRDAFLNLARSLEMTTSENLYGEFSLFGHPNMASTRIFQDERDRKWFNERKIELAMQDIQVLDDLQKFESFPAWKKVRLLRAIIHSRMIKPLDGKIVLGILDTLLKSLPDIVHAAFSKEHPEVKTLPPSKAGQMLHYDHEEILDGKMLIHLMVSSYLREFNSDFLQHRVPHDWNFKNSKAVDFELFKNSDFVKPYIESILNDLMQASKDFYSNIGLAVVFSSRKPLPPKALKWATQQIFSLQKFIEKEFDSVSKLHHWIEDELIPRHIDTELLTPIFYGLIFDHPEWIKNRDDLKALMNTDYFWPKRGSLDVEPSKTEEAIMTGIKEQAKKFPRFWSIEPSAAEALHDRIVRSKETREIYDNQFQSQLDLWLALSSKGVTSTSDQLFESLFERSNEEQKDILSKEALEGRIWDQPLKAKLIRRMIWKDQNFLELKAKNSKTQLSHYERDRLIRRVINNLDQALPERGIAYVQILEDFANEIRATKDETDSIEEAKNIHQNAPSNKAQDYILRSVSEIMDEVLTWKLEDQWDFIKFVRGDISASPFIRSIFPAIGPERVRRMFQILPLSVRAGLLETFLASPRGLLADEKSKDKGFDFYSQIMIDHILRDSKSEAKTIARQVLDAFLYALRETGNKRIQPHVFGYLLAMLKENEESSVGATLRHVLEIFGATGIKIGQFLAISQILPEEENHHLLHLQDHALIPERKRIFKELVEISGQDPFPFELQEIIGAASLKYAVMATHRESNEDFVLKVLRNEAVNHTNLEFMQLQKMADRLVEVNGSRYGIFRAIIRASQKAVQRELQLDQEALRSQKARQSIYYKNPFSNVKIEVPAELVVAPRLMASQYAPAMSFKELPAEIKPMAARGILKIEVENLFQALRSDQNMSSEIVFDPDRHSGNYRVAFTRMPDSSLQLTISPIDFGQVLDITFEQREQVFDLFSLAQILPKTGITRWAAEKILKTVKSNTTPSQIDSLVKALTPYFQKIPDNTKPISLYYSVLAALEDVNLGLPIVFFDFPRAIIQLAHYTQFVSDLDKTLDPGERLKEIVTIRSEAMKNEMTSEILKTDGLAGKVISESIEGNQSRTTKFILGCRNLIEKLRNGS